MKKSLKYYLTHPATAVTTLLSGGILAVDPSIMLGILAALWASAGTLFTAMSVAAFSVIPNVPALSPIGPAATAAALVAGALYVAKLLNRVINRIQDRV